MIFVAEPDLSGRLRRLRTTVLRLTQEEMAKRLGVKRSAYKNWEYGDNMPPDSVLPTLRDLGMEDAPIVRAGVRTKPRRLVSGRVGRLRIAGAVAAGDGANDIEPEELDNVPIEFAQPDYSGLIADGPSMLPYIQPGDILVFKDSKVPKLNRIVCARIDADPQLVVKTLTHSGDQWVLEAANANFGSIIPTHHLDMIGYLVGIIGDGIRIGPDERGLDIRAIDGYLRSRLPDTN